MGRPPVPEDPGIPDNTAVMVSNLSKHFRIPKERKNTTYDHLISLLHGKNTAYDEFWALKDVSFSVRNGETFGVIGPNGSGKSTLLKILAGVLFPDSGSAQVNGKIAPFLELGVGFQPDLTVKENIYLYGAIMGLSRREIDRRYEGILDFSELKRFESMRLKNLSSGMTVRLAFSTAIQTNPEILLVDEVLAVGDEEFQGKCSKKIEEIRREGRTIVFVSHDLDTVQRLCGRSLLLDHGEIQSIGNSEDVIRDYHAMLQGR